MLKNLIQNILLAWKLPRWRWALLTAVVSDILGFGVALFPPILWVLDAITAVVLFAVLGFRWPLLPALAIEVVPGLQLFPAWTLVVAALASVEKASRGDEDSQQDEPKPYSPQVQKGYLR
jgi:hypothetical protein